MSALILKGTTGVWKKNVINTKLFGNNNFVVTHDVSIEADKLPVRFANAPEGCYVNMKDVSFDTKAKDK